MKEDLDRVNWEIIFVEKDPVILTWSFCFSASEE